MPKINVKETKEYKEITTDPFAQMRYDSSKIMY